MHSHNSTTCYDSQSHCTDDETENWRLGDVFGATHLVGGGAKSWVQGDWFSSLHF